MFVCDHAPGFFISRLLLPDAFAAFAKCLSNPNKRSARRGCAGRAPPAAFLPDWAAPMTGNGQKYPWRGLMRGPQSLWVVSPLAQAEPAGAASGFA